MLVLTEPDPPASGSRSQPDSGPTPEHWYRLVPASVYGIIALAMAVRATVATLTGYTSEDYLITLRYAENAALGRGMVYNVGERVLGTTTPLYTLFLAAVRWMHGPPTIFGKALNIAADGALCLLLYLWLRHEGLERAGRLAALVAAVHPLHLQWSISGMETSLVAAGGVWALYAFSRRQYLEMYLALGLLFLVRWDSLLLGAVLTTALIFVHRKRSLPWRAFGIFALIITPWLLAAGLYYGNPIPITGEAKVRVYGWYADHSPAMALRAETTGSGQGLTSLVRFEPTWLLRRAPQQQKLLNFFIGTPPALLLAFLAAEGLRAMVPARRRRLYPAIAWFGLYIGGLLLSRVLLFNWYLVPPLPVWEMLAAIGAEPLLTRLWRRCPRPLRSAAGFAACGGAAFGVTVVMTPVLRESQQAEERVRVPAGRWLRANALPGDRVLLEPIGYIGYYSQCSVIDVIGLVSPEVLPFYGATARAPWLAQIRAFQPEWCVLRPYEAAGIERASAEQGYDWKTRYTVAHTFSSLPAGRRPGISFLIYRHTGVPREP